MTATNHTANYGLFPFAPSDYSSWQGDRIEDMLKTGSAIHHVTSAGGPREVSVSTPPFGGGPTAKVGKTATASTTKELTAQQLDSMWADSNGIARVSE